MTTAHTFCIFHGIRFKVRRSRRHVNVDGFIVNPHPCGSLEDSMSKVYRRVSGEEDNPSFAIFSILSHIQWRWLLLQLKYAHNRIWPLCTCACGYFFHSISGIFFFSIAFLRTFILISNLSHFRHSSSLFILLFANKSYIYFPYFTHPPCLG